MDSHPMTRSGFLKKKCQLAYYYNIKTCTYNLYTYSIIYDLPIERLSQNTYTHRYERRRTYIMYIYIYLHEEI